MPLAIASTAPITNSWPVFPLRLVTASAYFIYDRIDFPFFSTSSSGTSYSAFSKGGNVWLQTRGQPFCFGTAIKCAVREIEEAQFSEVVLKSDHPVLVEFMATWCSPCRLVAPTIQSLAHDYEDKLLVVKIDHDDNPRLIEEYKVYWLPTLIVFRNEQEVPKSRRQGAITKAKLKEYIDKHLENVSLV